jgi:hypothetical protein
MRKIVIFTFLFDSLSVVATERLGSPAFTEMTKGSIPWSNALEYARSPEAASNAFFGNYDIADHLRNTPADFGPGQRHFMAAEENMVANVAMAAAKTDPRSTSFIGESLITAINENQYPLGEHEAMTGDEGNSDLSELQYGDSNNRYLDAIAIEPELGYFQTADNEQAFQSTYDNILLGRAEESLFENDATSAKKYFDQQFNAYKSETDKQNTATGYQREGITRSQQTAATFRDFYRFKSQVSQANLNLMPTRESLIANCESNFSWNIDQNGIYNYIMEPVYSVSEFTPPMISTNFCQEYVNGESNYLIRNNHVSEKLKDIVKDSDRMATGLDEIEKTLGNKNLSLDEIARFLNNNPVWKEFALRQEAWEGCKETGCLDKQEEKIKALLDYEGGLEGKNPLTSSMREKIRTIISSGKLPKDLAIPIEKINGVSTLNLASNSKGIPSRALGKNGQRMSPESFIQSRLKNNGIESPSGDQVNGRYLASGSGDSSYGYGNTRLNRDSNGVLRNSSGKVVPGFEAPSHHDLFKIISIRYRKKFFGE